jgi:hypothetical protein
MPRNIISKAFGIFLFPLLALALPAMAGHRVTILDNFLAVIHPDEAVDSAAAIISELMADQLAVTAVMVDDELSRLDTAALRGRLDSNYRKLLPLQNLKPIYRAAAMKSL